MVIIEDVPIRDIVVESRARKVFGLVEMNALERNIREVGLLQPIAVTPDKRLIFGARRLRACQRIGMETIPARIIDIDADDPSAILRMESDENEHRLDFTPSERVEIARRIEESLAGRRGSNQHQKKVDGQNFGDPPQGRSDEVAAKSVGLNRETYRQAKAVVDSGQQDVIERMDKGNLSIHAAHEEVKQTREATSAPPSGVNKENGTNRMMTFKVTLYKHAPDDARILVEKAGSKYCVELAMSLLKFCGHKVEVE